MSHEVQFKSIQDAITVSLVDTTRTAGHIATEDLAFQRSSNPSIAHTLDTQNARLLALTHRLIRQAVTGSEIKVPKLPDADALEDNWTSIVDVVDNLLEKADACLDEYTGVIKRHSPLVQETSTLQRTVPKQRPSRAYRDYILPKPQLLFNRVPTNDELAAFKPLLRTKPHAIVSFEESIGQSISENGFSKFKHPYETEVAQYRYPSSVYMKADPIAFLPFESSRATFVDSQDAVQAMLVELKGAKEIAVDLEHHDTHSYIGLVSLMQISTRDKDWIIDTLKPWREDLQLLNEVFADPKILKVFHGARMDMIWLQRDLGLYVVGLFDTFHASNSLGYHKHSLASLLARFAKFDAQKKYQLADWRIRPLPVEMFEYARSDTHFLLYIYDNMRNELIEQSNHTQSDGDLINTVLEESKKETLQRYERPFYDAHGGLGPNGWFNLLVRTPALFTKEQFAVFRAVHQWRDTLARKEDEGVNTIMPKTAMFNIAREMPVDIASLLGCSHPISTHVRLHAGDLLKIIKEAKSIGSSGPDMKDFMDLHPANSKRPLEKSDQPDATLITKALVIPPLQMDQIVQSDASIRIDTSRFWGTTVSTEIQQNCLEVPGHRMEEMRLAIPLPQLTAEVIHGVAVGDRDNLVSPPTPSVVAEHQYVKNRKPVGKSVFVIKELGGSVKKKAEDLKDDLSANSTSFLEAKQNNAIIAVGNNDEMDIASNSVDIEPLALEKAKRKAERKLRKKLEKEQRKKQEPGRQENANNNGANDDVEEEVFDYAHAPSVLHAKPDYNDRAGPKKSFDPYTKSLDAPKGMRKSKREIAGKSITYRS